MTLLTSLWKAGKTTLVNGLIRQLETGEPFLGRATKPANTFYVSEEPKAIWASRFAVAPAGRRFELMCRPFRRRPSPDEWHDLIDYAVRLREAGRLDLFVVDPLASFLPGRSENDSATMLDALLPLQGLAEAGAAVLLLHHPRKAASDEGYAARGTGALTGCAAVVLELARCTRVKLDANRRKLVGLSRRAETPSRVAYEWDPATAAFAVVSDEAMATYRENWPVVLRVLQSRTHAGSCKELLADWPDEIKPHPSALYRWLTRAFEEKTVRRVGRGTRVDPYRFRLPEPADEYRDRGELVPLDMVFGREAFGLPTPRPKTGRATPRPGTE